METGHDIEKANKKVQTLLKKKIIQGEDLDILSKEEKQQLNEVLTAKLRELSGPERDRFLGKIDNVISRDTKRDIWESNHINISHAISSLMGKNGNMPTKSQIAEETGLSRQTIHKHFKEYKEHPLFLEHEEQFKFIKGRMM